MAVSAPTPAKKKNTKKAADRPAMAVHGSTKNHNVVGIGNLRVVVCVDDGIWFAQGLEIDYASQGKSLAEVQRNFEHGLRSTVGLHLQAFDTIEKLLVPAPREVWKEMMAETRRFRFSQISVHEIEPEDELSKLAPYTGIEYVHTTNEVAA